MGIGALGGIGHWAMGIGALGALGNGHWGIGGIGGIGEWALGRLGGLGGLHLERPASAQVMQEPSALAETHSVSSALMAMA